MDLAAKRFVRWILLFHVLLLAIVIVMVYFAAREVYTQARHQALEQGTKRQTLLAEQTAKGIEGFYKSILDTLDLLRRSQEGNSEQAQIRASAQLLPLVRNVIAPVLSNQLRNRASLFMVVDRTNLSPLMVYPNTDTDKATQIIQQGQVWLKAVRLPGVGPMVKVGDETSNILCVPTGQFGRMLFVAVVPVDNIDDQFLKTVHAEKRMTALVLDENMRVLTAFDKDIIGLSIIDDTKTPSSIKQLAQRYIKQGIAGSDIIEEPFQLGQHVFNSGIVSVHPIDLLGKTWWLAIGSDLEVVDSILKGTFEKTLIWAGFFVVSMTMILGSTSLLLIRGRLRMERMQHDVLKRELEQARTIQLAWLPRNDEDPLNVDVCAVNKPASHISGDFYNWFDLKDGRICVVIGDVTGHGMAAAFLMATTQLLVRIIMPRAADAGKCLEAVNYQLCKQVFSGQFVTMQILILDPANGKVELATAGHPPPLIRRDGVFEPFDMKPQLVLGIEKGQQYTSQIFNLPEEATIVMYTDGVIEAKNHGGDWMGTEGLCKSLNGKSTTSQALADEVVAIVDRFREGLELADDLTLVAIRLDPAAKMPHKVT